MAFINQGKFEAMKMLSGQSTPRGDKHHFVLNDGEYLNHLRDIIVKKLKAERRKIYEKWRFHDRTLSHLAVFRVTLGHLISTLLITKALKGEPGRLNKLFVVKLYGFCV